jgi:hypothetical protein
VAGRTVGSLSVVGAVGVVVLGALVALAAVLVFGDGGPVGWVVVAGAAACASGLVLGLTQRITPALAPAVVAAAALALAAVAATGDDEPRVFGAAQIRDERPRTDPGDAARDEGAVAGSAAARPTPAQFLRSYYAAIDAGRFREAWSRLSAADDTQFDEWRAGFDTTVSQRVEDVRTEPGNVVRFDLVAVDRTPCGTTTERRFEIRWRLVPNGDSFAATALGAVKLDGVDPMVAC